MKTLITAFGTALVIASSASAMVHADLTQRDIAEGVTGRITAGQVQTVDTSGQTRNMANGVYLPAQKTVTEFSAPMDMWMAGDYR